MAVLATSGITLPKTIAEGLWKKAQSGSVVALLSGAEPQKFGEVTYMTLTGRPKAELVGEGGEKGPTAATFGSKVALPHKYHVTMRFNEEVKWADEDHQLGVLTALADETGLALGRALDLGVFHGINPLPGTVAASIPAADRIAATTNSVEITTATLTTPDLVIEQAAGLVIADGFRPTGIAFDPTYAWNVSTSRYADGRKKFPELGLGMDVTSFDGIRASTGDTVSATQEAAAPTNVKAIVGQWDLLRWGVQRKVPVEMIEFGDPDGLGDLKRFNQIALRSEVVYGWGLMDRDGGFATVKDAVTNV